jgi:hypothetical protein
VRRAALLTAALALLAPSSAGAQEAAPAVGGGSFATAPLIEPGSYRDTILPGERLFYGIELQAGQRLRVKGQLDYDDDDISPSLSNFSVGIQTPLREVDISEQVGEDIAGNDSVVTDLRERIEYVSAPVLTASAAREETGNYRGPGTWYVSLYLANSEQEPPPVEIPVNLELGVQGSPQRDPSPEPTPAKAAPKPSQEDSGGDGPSLLAVIGLGLAGALVGLAAGALLGRRPRPA